MKAWCLFIAFVAVLAFPCAAQEVEFECRLISTPEPLEGVEHKSLEPGVIWTRPAGGGDEWPQSLTGATEIWRIPVTVRPGQCMLTSLVGTTSSFRMQEGMFLSYPDGRPLLTQRKPELFFSLHCEVANVFENNVGIYGRPSVRDRFGFRQRPVEVQTLKKKRVLTFFPIEEPDVSVFLASGTRTLIYLGRDDQEIGGPRYLYVLVKTALASPVSSL